MPDFTERLRALQHERQSALCVGLDPVVEKLPRHLLETHAAPADAVAAFNAAITRATAPFACAFKLNLAFYEALGPDGWRVLEETLAAIPEDVLTIADGKRGDIGHSARFYAASVFERMGFDACTVAPYMGADSVAPFLEKPGAAAFVLARTTNRGATSVQQLVVEDEPLYLRLAREAVGWAEGAPGTVGLVAGAADAEALGKLRAACPAAPFLIPGVGAQGGSVAATMQAAATARGLVLVSSSRSIIYASAEEDFAEAAARVAESLRDALEAHRPA